MARKWLSKLIALVLILAMTATAVASGGINTPEAPTLGPEDWGNTGMSGFLEVVKADGEPYIEHGKVKAIWSPTDGLTYVNLWQASEALKAPLSITIANYDESSMLISASSGMQVILQKLDYPRFQLEASDVLDPDQKLDYVRADLLFQALGVEIVWTALFYATIYTDTHAPETYVTPDPYRGDVDDDGYVTINDASIVGRHMLGQYVSGGEWSILYDDNEFAAADYDGNGFVSDDDFRGILNRVSLTPLLQTTVAAPERGDISADGRISMQDIVLIGNYIWNSGTLTPEQMLVADFDQDGDIDPVDAVLIDSVRDPVAFNGDLDLNGIFDEADIGIIERHISGENVLTDEASLSRADMDKSGLIDIQDVELANAIQQYGKPYPAGPTPTPAPRLIGDIDGNGIVTDDDAMLLRLYLLRAETLTDEQLQVADCYEDDMIDIFDAALIYQAAAGLIDLGELTPEASQPESAPEPQSESAEAMSTPAPTTGSSAESMSAPEPSPEQSTTESLAESAAESDPASETASEGEEEEGASLLNDTAESDDLINDE